MSDELEDTGFGTQHPIAANNGADGSVPIGSYRMIDRHFNANYPAFTGGPASDAQLTAALAQFAAGQLVIVGAEVVYDALGNPTASSLVQTDVVGNVGTVALNPANAGTLAAHRAYYLNQVEQLQRVRPDLPVVIEFQAMASRNLWTVSPAMFASWRPTLLASCAEFTASTLGQAVDGLAIRMQWIEDERISVQQNVDLQRTQLEQLGKLWRDAGWTKHLAAQIWPVRRARILANGTTINNDGGIIARELNRDRMRRCIVSPWDRLLIWDYYISGRYVTWPPPWYGDLVRIALEAQVRKEGGVWPL
ncbi:MAG: hypothetical protein SFW09_07940 [Hyphomicrobiaceae bacterium]|nr:hypothetical protein [Hyphomicrobiaceae bacterium]